MYITALIFQMSQLSSTIPWIALVIYFPRHMNGEWNQWLTDAVQHHRDHVASSEKYQNSKFLLNANSFSIIAKLKIPKLTALSQ